jgi:prepilin-type N-terminal cleavage/methylation domain-containing protein
VSSSIDLCRLRRLAAGQQGFSLIEALVATSLLGIISLGFALGADRAVRFNVHSRSVTVATTLAQAKLEELASKVSTDAQLTAGAHADAANPLTAHGTAGGMYTRTWFVTNNTPATGLKTVQVTVTWSLYTDPHTVNLVMVKS